MTQIVSGTKDRHFIVSTLAIGVSQAIQQVQPLALVAVYLHRASAAAFGQWATVLLTVTAAVLCCQANLQLAMVRFIAGERDRARAAGRVRRVLALVLALGATGSLATFVFADGLARFAGAPEIAPLIRIAAPLVALQTLLMAGQFGLTAARRDLLMAGISGGMAIVELCGASLPILSHASVAAGLAGFVIARAAHVALTFAFLLREYPDASAPELSRREIFRYTLPALPATLALWVVISSDRYLLTRYHGAAALGQYAAVLALANLLVLIPVPLGITLFPRVIELIKAGDKKKAERYLGHAMGILISIVGPIATLLFVLGSDMLSLLATGAVAVATLDVMPWAVAAGALAALATPYFTALQVTDDAVVLGAIWVVVGVIVVMAGWLLIPPLGAWGAVFARTLGMLVALVAMAVASSRKIGVPIDLGMAARAVVGCVALALVAHFFLPITRIAQLVGVGLLASVVYVAVVLALERSAPPERRLATHILRLWPAVELEESG